METSCFFPSLFGMANGFGWFNFIHSCWLGLKYTSLCHWWSFVFVLLLKSCRIRVTSVNLSSNARLCFHCIAFSEFYQLLILQFHTMNTRCSNTLYNWLHFISLFKVIANSRKGSLGHWTIGAFVPSDRFMEGNNQFTCWWPLLLVQLICCCWHREDCSMGGEWVHWNILSTSYGWFQLEKSTIYPVTKKNKEGKAQSGALVLCPNT